MKTFIIGCLMVLTGLHGFSQAVIISGKVTDELNRPIDEASVYSPASKTGTITNDEGTFFLMLDEGKIELSFFADGFSEEQYSLVLEKDTTLNILLEKESNLKGKAIAKENKLSTLPGNSSPIEMVSNK